MKGCAKVQEEEKVLLVEDRRMKYLANVVEEWAKDQVNVKGGRINDLGCMEDQRISLANVGWKLKSH